MEGGELWLVGGVHRDREAEPALERLLARLRPELITVELSPYGLRFRRERAPALRRLLRRRLRPMGVVASQHPVVCDLLELLRLPFEFRAALRYARQEPGVAVCCVDADGPSREYLRLFELEVLRPDNLWRLLSLPPGDGLLAERRRALHVLRRGRYLPPPDPLRERLLARRIRHLVARLRPRRTVHVGGWQHLLPDWMFGWLRDLRPRRVLLLGAEVIEVGLEDQGGGHPIQGLPVTTGGEAERSNDALGLHGGEPFVPQHHPHP